VTKYYFFLNSRWRTVAILKIVKTPYLNKSHPILMKFGRLKAGCVSRFVIIGVLKFHYAALSVCVQQLLASQAPTPLSRNHFLGIGRITAHWTFWYYGGVEIKKKHAQF